MSDRSDVGIAVVLRALNADMRAGGARRASMGYLYTPDVDATIAAIAADGGAVHMPATDLPVGRLAMLSDPQGAVFYVMNPIPPAGMEDRDSDGFRSEERRVGKEWGSTC